jgi:hypothetical protein
MPRLAGKAAFLTGAGNGIGFCSPAKAPKLPLLRSPPEPVTKPLTLRKTKRSRSEPTWGPRRSPTGADRWQRPPCCEQPQL